MAIREKKLGSINKSRKRLDLTGKIFHYFTVDSFNCVKNRKTQWNCTCKCGKKAVVEGRLLTSGNTKSCGCWHKEYLTKIKTNGRVTADHNIYCKYRHESKKGNVEFNLNNYEFSKIVHSNCHHCGTEPSRVYSSNKKYHGDKLHNGIDRVDSSKGYIIGNVVPCCYQCNSMKLDYSVGDFLKQVEKIYKRFF